MDVFLRFQVNLHFFNGKVKENALEDQKWLRCVWEWQCMISYIKGKAHPRTGPEGPEREYNFSFTLSLNSTLD